MEEGELSDSDCEPPQGAAAGPVETSRSEMPSRPPTLDAVKTFRRSDVPGLSSESSDQDSDDDAPAFVKRKRREPASETTGRFTNPLLQSAHRGPTGISDSRTQEGKLKPHQAYVDLDSMDTNTAPTRRKKNMWGSVLAEQDLAGEIGKFGVEKKDLSVLSYRDVEAYEIPKRSQIHYELSDPSDGEDCPKKVEVDMDAKEADTDTEEKEAKDEGLFEMETFGTDAKKQLPKLTVKDRLGKTPGSNSDSDSDSISHRYDKRVFVKHVPESVDFDKELERYKLKRKRIEEKPKRKNAKDRLGKKHHKPPIPNDYISVTETDSTEVIVNAMVTNLQEPKVRLMTRVVEVLGAKKAIDMMNETATIESSGGLMINDGSRRRTPGGVFLFLLRNDRHVRKDEVDLIFKEEREVFNKERRKVLRAKRAHLASMNLPQDAYMGRESTKKTRTKDTVSKEGTEPVTATMETEEGEIEDDDLTLEPELEIQLE